MSVKVDGTCHWEIYTGESLSLTLCLSLSSLYSDAEWSTSMSRSGPRNCYASSLMTWHKGAYYRTFQCMEATIPYAIKNQRGASKDPLGLFVPKPLVGGFGCPSWVEQHYEALDQ